MWRLGLALCLLWSVEQKAHAIAACTDGDGWALASGATVPVHPRLAYFYDERKNAGLPKTISAKLDGKAVTAKVTWTGAAPFQLAIIEIDSEKPGKLTLAWPALDTFYPSEREATFTIAAKKLPAEVKATTRRFHRAYHHSTVHESDDGLEVVVDAQAIAFTAKWRRDDKTAWQTMELTANTVDGKQVARFGELGCSGNFATAMLEKGIDLELTALLADGQRVKVSGLPAHVLLPKLPKDAPVSSP